MEDRAKAVTLLTSPLGPVTLMANSRGLTGCAFAAGMRSHQPAAAMPHLDLAREFITQYFSGAAPLLSSFLRRGLGFDFNGSTPLERRVYEALMEVPWGATVSYAKLAEMAGIPRGARFAGNVMAKNRFAIIIPCHRVIRSSGDWGNYTGGRKKKEFLLLHEGVPVEEVKYGDR
jgi:methylated-DNA-[protein]-cysteine S-methyltransferase